MQKAKYLKCIHLTMLCMINHIWHTTFIHYVTLLAYLLMLNQSQGGHFWHGRPARPHLCVQNKYTLVYTPLRGWSDSEIMGKEGRESRRGQRGEERGGCENNAGVHTMNYCCSHKPF